MERFLLKGLDLFRGLFTMLGVDYDQLRVIVAIKLITDNRRQSVAYGRKEKKEPSNVFLITLAVYALLGMFVMLAMTYIASFMPVMILFFSYMIVMVALTLITDFSAVLLDTSDNTILLPRPVDGRTLFVARTVHILLYLSQLSVGLSIIPTVYVSISYGIGLGFLFVIGVVLAVIIALFTTNAIYLLIMWFASEEKLKNVINYFQIVMGIVIVGGYQILPRVLSRIDMSTYVFEWTWWKYLIPPIWIAGALEAFEYQYWDFPHFLVIALALVIPFGGFYIVSRYLTPIFSRKLGAMGSNADQPQQVKVSAGAKGVKSAGWITKVSGYVTFSSIERGAMEVVYRILGRDRKIKLKVYPAFGYIPIFGIVFLFRDQKSLMETWQTLPESHYYLVLIYLTFMIVQIAIFEISFSDEFKASWIYFSAPVEKPGEILSGMIKAIFVRLVLPGYIVIAAVVIFIWGISVVDDLVFGLLNNYLMMLTMAMISKRHLPLSMAPSTRSQSGNIARSMLTFLLLGLLGLTHYFLTMKPVLILAAIPIQAAALYFLDRAYRNTPWSRITL
jgi:ABC-2 type transport system permease protein